MKTLTRKKGREPADPFTSFKDATAKAFSFLVTDYGFKHIDTIVYVRECAIKYRNETTGVIVSYEWGSAPWVVLARLKDPIDFSVVERMGVRFILMERCPSDLVDYGEEQLKGQDLEKTLNHDADALKRCGHDILTGDFQVFPKLRKLVEAETRRLNLDYFGSETGETPNSH